jgi:hypothetical protein
LTVKERLIEFIECKGISIREFERICEFPYTTVNNIKTSIQPDKLLSIDQYFPELNFKWLLIGRGDMLLSGNANNPDTNVDLSNMETQKLHF